MKIYMVRHEDRTQDCSFYAPLTKKGLKNSVELIKNLKMCNINKIYSSPFIRSLQTIYPYSKEADIKVNLEYGLEEINHQDIIAPKAAGVCLPEYIAESFNHNPSYKTVITADAINYPEKSEEVMTRIKRFLRTVIDDTSAKEQEGGGEHNIVLVTHQCVCSNILNIINKARPDLHLDLEKEYEKGKMSLIFDNGWTFKAIN